MSRAQKVLGLMQLRGRSTAVRQFANRPWDASNPTGYWVGRASAYSERKPTPSNTWILHPWIPIDIRVPLFVGVVGAATVLYLERTKSLHEAQAQVLATWQASREWAQETYTSAQNMWESSMGGTKRPAGGTSAAGTVPLRVFAHPTW